MNGVPFMVTLRLVVPGAGMQIKRDLQELTAYLDAASTYGGASEITF